MIAATRRDRFGEIQSASENGIVGNVYEESVVCFLTLQLLIPIFEIFVSLEEARGDEIVLALLLCRYICAVEHNAQPESTVTVGSTVSLIRQRQ